VGDDLICALSCIEPRIHFFIHFPAHYSSGEGRGASSPMRTRDILWPTATSNGFAGSTLKTGQRKVMKSLHLVLGKSLDCFPVDLASRTCLANVFRGILDRWLNQRSWDPSIRKSVSILSVLRISKVCTLSRSVTPWMPKWRVHFPSYLSKGRKRGTKMCFDNCLTGNFHGLLR